MAVPPAPFPCPSCGVPLPAGARFCNVCGHAIAAPASPAPAPPARVLAQTMLGGVGTPMEPAAPGKRPFAGTMLGMPVPSVTAPTPPSASPPPAQSAPAKPLLASTMVGVAPFLQPPPPAVHPPAVGAQGAPRPLASTVVGLAPPVLPGQPTQRRQQNVPKSTILGVALPGIAPTHAAPAPVAFASADAPLPVAPIVAPAFVPPPPPTAPDLPPRPAARASRAPAIALAVVAVLGLVVAVTLVLLLRPKAPPAMSGELAGEPAAPKLIVSCSACGAGSELELGGKKAQFTQGKATVAIDPTDARVGKHDFTGTLRVGSGRAQAITLQVLVPFSVRPSLAPLAKGVGEVDVELELADEVSAVTIDGKKVPIVNHLAREAVAIPPPEGEARAFEKVVAYAVGWAGGERKGSVKLVVPYASLKLGLPGRRAYVVGDAELDVTGRATPKATVRLGSGADAPSVTADKDGAFKARVKIGAGDEKLELLAFGAQAAPRSIALPITHAASWAEVEKSLRAQAKGSAAAVAAPAEHLDQVVDVKADVVTLFEEDGRAGFRGDVHDKDAADGGIGAPVRVLLPSGASVQKGDVVEVLGVLTRAVPLVKEKITLAEIDVVVVAAKR